MSIEKTNRMNLLLDAYSTLLTPYQKEIMELYFEEDLSLKEISEEYEISRNAVFTLIKRVTTILEEYEEKLGLVRRKEKILELLEKETDIEVLKSKIEDLFYDKGE